jgi:type I restriction enzyme S subunit
VQPGDHHPGGIALIRLADLANPDPQLRRTKQIDPAIEAAYERSRLTGGELLIGCVGHTIGVACIAPKEWGGANIARAVARVRLRPGIPAEFVLQQVRTPAVQRYFTAELRVAGQPTLNIKQIKETSILLPPSELRDRFALIFNKTQESHRERIQSGQFAEKLFLALQQRAFRGELDLSRLFLEEDVKAIEQAADRLHKLVHVTLPKNLGTKRAKSPFVAPLEIEPALKVQDATVEKGSPIPWSADYFKYRILAALPAPFSFADLMQKAETIFEESPPYETIRDMIFDLLGQDGKRAILRQRFDQREVKEHNPEGKEITSFVGRREIVFEPVP